jgi:hypothetical protein
MAQADALAKKRVGLAGLGLLSNWTVYPGLAPWASNSSRVRCARAGVVRWLSCVASHEKFPPSAKTGGGCGRRHLTLARADALAETVSASLRSRWGGGLVELSVDAREIRKSAFKVSRFQSFWSKPPAAPGGRVGPRALEENKRSLDCARDDSRESGMTTRFQIGFKVSGRNPRQHPAEGWATSTGRKQKVPRLRSG